MYYVYQDLTSYLEDKAILRNDIKTATERFLAEGGTVLMVPKKSTKQLIRELSQAQPLTNRYMFGKDIKDIYRY